MESIASEPFLRSTRPVDAARSTTLSLLMGRTRRGGGSSGGRSMLVRETAAHQLDERRADWGYSKPVVALDIIWNIAFAIVSAIVLITTYKETPDTPIRVWISGYAIQCIVHVVLVWLEYRRRSRRRRRSVDSGGTVSDSDVVDSEDDDVAGYWRFGDRSSVAKRCESINTMASFVWWVVGFYWVVSGGESLLQNAPQLYWLAVVFLAFDIFFAIFCVVLACVIGIALCCCLPCIIAILYAVAGQEGASDADISILPRFRFYQDCSDGEKIAAGSMIPISTNGGASAVERILLPEDAECCICLTAYDEGAELHSLPCNHHFHSTCIVKWLRINATCPLCKYNILKGDTQV